MRGKAARSRVAFGTSSDEGSVASAGIFYASKDPLLSFFLQLVKAVLLRDSTRAVFTR